MVVVVANGSSSCNQGCKVLQKLQLMLQKLKMDKEDQVKEAVDISPKTSEGERKGRPIKGKEKVDEEKEIEPPSEDGDSDDLDDYLAFLSKKFSKLRFRKNSSSSRFPKKNFQTNKSGFDNSRIKCYICGTPGHFANQCNRSNSEKKGQQFETVDYKKKYFELLKDGKALVSKEKDWAAGDDSDEEEEFVNLALMAKSTEEDASNASTASNQVFSTNLTELSKDECASSVNELSIELYHVHVSLKMLTKENIKLKESNVLLTDRNLQLESQFIEFEKMKTECMLAKEQLTESLNREQMVKNELARAE